MREHLQNTVKGKFMSDILKGYSAHSIGAHDFVELSMDEFLKLNPIPTNRDSARRVSKMKSTFNDAYIANQTGTLTEVAIGIVENDFVDPQSNTKYIQGSWFVIDGNTRQHFWKQYPEKARLIPVITAKIHYLNSMDDVRFAYYPYNNAKSSEKASEILQGLARQYNWSPRQNVFINGGYKSAIDWASFTPGEDRADVFKAFNICFDGLKILDSIPKDSAHTITKPNLDPLKSQAIIAAFLTALRFSPHNIKLHDMIARISTIDKEEIDRAILKGELDPVQVIAVEYTGQSIRRSKNMDAIPWLNGLARSTKFDSQTAQMDFLMYWIGKYLENPKVTYNFNKGIRPEYWSGAWYDYFPEEE